MESFHGGHDYADSPLVLVRLEAAAPHEHDD